MSVRLRIVRRVPFAGGSRLPYSSIKVWNNWHSWGFHVCCWVRSFSH